MCMVRIDPQKTQKRDRQTDGNLCSKGNAECRVSNSRLVNQIRRLSALSPRIVDGEVPSSSLLPDGTSITTSVAQSPLGFTQMKGKTRKQSHESKDKEGVGEPQLTKKRHTTVSSLEENRSSSMLMDRSSQMRDSATNLRSSDAKFNQKCKLSKGDLLKQRQVETIVKNTFSQSRPKEIRQIQQADE